MRISTSVGSQACPESWALFGTMVLRDPALALHAVRGALVASVLGDAMEVHVDTWGMLLRDVGSLGVPQQLVSRPGPLTSEERQLVAAHPVSGADLVSRLPGLPRETARVVRHHHERWDGRGYPDGLKGADIPAGARLAAVADTFAALTSARPHRPEHTILTSLGIVTENSGTQFDPQAVRTAGTVFPEIASCLSGECDVRSAVGERLWAHVLRASELSGAQRDALFAAALGLKADEAAARLGRSTGTQRTWAASLRRTLAVPPRTTVRSFLVDAGRHAVSVLG